MPPRQRGAALLMAMVIVTVVATVASSMVWQQWRAVQVETAERGRSQSQWMLYGALDWARLILREDGFVAPGVAGVVDHLGEPWAHELAEARVSSFLAIDQNNTDDAADAFLSGKIEDEHARYNLRNLLDANGVIDPLQVDVLRRLCGNLNLSPTVANVIADALQKATLATLDSPPALTALGGEAGKAKAAVLPQTVGQLVWLSPGLDVGTVQRLRPFVTLLPMTATAPTAVNLNTAPREVIAAMIPNASLADADRLVRVRQNKPFDTTVDAQNVLGAVLLLPAQGLDVKSEYFEVRGRLRLEDQVIEQRHLVRRDLSNPQNPVVTVLNQERLSGVDSGKGGW